ncbi:hypothetical protein [Gimesia aquarii]|uniref:hypothetical protein n=1 Tax=Gimesia aquarii TaxID=2527964 RepID=UPI0011A866D8|nr:hypothetical protein [Gimesia aquarii]
MFSIHFPLDTAAPLTKLLTSASRARVKKFGMLKISAPVDAITIKPPRLSRLSKIISKTGSQFSLLFVPNLTLPEHKSPIHWSRKYQP